MTLLSLEGKSYDLEGLSQADDLPASMALHLFLFFLCPFWDDDVLLMLRTVTVHSYKLFSFSFCAVSQYLDIWALVQISGRFMIKNWKGIVTYGI